MPKLHPDHISHTNEEDAIITAAAMSDPDCLPLTDEEWEQAMQTATLADKPPMILQADNSINLVKVVVGFKYSDCGAIVVKSFNETTRQWQHELHFSTVADFYRNLTLKKV